MAVQISSEKSRGNITVTVPVHLACGARDGVYVATGHSVWGILDAPGRGEALAELIAKGISRATDLTPFDPAGLRSLDPSLLRSVSRSPTAESLAQLSDILGLDCRCSISPRIAHICEDVRNLGVIEIPTEGGHGGRGRRS